MFKMMRAGKAIGTLNWSTDRLFIMKSQDFNLSKEKLRRMEKGEFINKRK
jgi:hypothetical protein